MPVYCYKCNCGKTKEVQKPMSKCELPELCNRCAFVMHRDFIAEHGGARSTVSNWPQHSDAAGVDESQTQEAMAHMTKQGCPTEYDSQGRAIFTSRKHRKDALEVMGMYDRNAGYGDRAPVNR